MLVQSRDQRSTMVLRGRPATGETAAIANEYEDEWIDLVPGVPALLPDGRLVMTGHERGTRRLLVGGESVTPIDLEVRSVVDVSEAGITFQANPRGDATELHVWRWHDGGLSAVTTDAGVHTAVVGGGTTVIRSATLDRAGSRVVTIGHRFASFAETPLVTPNVEIFQAGVRSLATAVLLPHGHDGSKLPVLLDPYGGPHALRVQRSSNAFASSQWFADQGFAVVVADGRGTPGRGSSWERTVLPRPRHPGARRPDRRTARRRRNVPPSSTSTGSPSAGGASAGTSRRSPCCAGPTCSTPRSPVRR